MKPGLIRGFRSYTALNHPNCSKETLTHSYVKNHNEWLTLLNYLKYLVKHPRECKFDRCVNILINIGDRILQYNKRSDALVGQTTRWEWNMGLLRQIDERQDSHQVTEDFGPSSLLNLIRILSDLRLYHTINSYKFNEDSKLIDKIKNNTAHSNATESKQKSYRFFSDLVEDVDPKSFKLNDSKFKAGKVGPLRYDTNQLMVYPKILTSPLCFELTGVNLLEELEKMDSEELGDGPGTARSKFAYFINAVTTQFLDQLLILVSNSNFTESKLCILSMYLSVMIYGPKLRNGSVSKIDYRVEQSLYRILDHICKAVRISGNELSFRYVGATLTLCRSLAYLANSCKHRAGLMKFVAEKLIGHSGPVGEHYLENFCFSFSRSYYEDDELYRKLASMVNEQADCLSPVVTSNLIFSFLRVGKLELVKERLFEKLLSFNGLFTPRHRCSDKELSRCGVGLLETMRRLLQGHRELEGLLGRINNLAVK
ncbi:conserved hypothetical protein [Theileria orientalis strain Shintoku]|uniref:Uncharacterized protein n=1 Tax=Theileria orientalis strain Shintoku TaxID=869250 RepID=J4CE16_THEOR|nr:conserved hypothetical protein [Theileria orientalis strain Shintoku]PVC50863.1 hypothetical protein MACL_00001980 [Theileria orientalis]BAM42107.1 conserved hypothetical protein [Theileria orientalis strain Shintoku]|eukprot:XP_009692408.1 conserved hypothetical protein [Theileria orientalis strain Shintoku]